MQNILKHKNKLLFGVLVVFLVITYVFEEKGNIDKKEQLIKNASILDSSQLGMLTSIEGLKINMHKLGDHFYDRELNLLISEDRLDEMFQILSSLRVIKIIDQQQINEVGIEQFIPDPTLKLSFGFSNGSMSFVLGKKLEFDSTFYMQITKANKTEVVLVNDVSADPGAYENEDDYRKSDAKYNRLQVVFYLTNRYFHDMSVFRDLKYSKDKINFDSITIATFRNKKFDISFKKTTTTPAPPEGLGYFEDNWVSFHDFLSTLSGKNIISPNNPKLLDEMLSRFEVNDRSGKKYTLDVYKKYDSKAGYFLKTSLNNFIYELSSEVAKHFFVNVQDFWLKSLYPKTTMLELEMTFLNQKEEKVIIEDKALFKATSKTHEKLRSMEFKKLVDFLKTPGDFVDDYHEKGSAILKHSVMKLQFNKREIDVILEGNEVVLVDVKNKIKIHYYTGTKIPFSLRYEDYFLD